MKSTSHPKTLGTPSESGHFDPNKTGFKRHYTECFCMRASVQSAIIRLAKSNSEEAADELFKAM